MIVCLLGNDPFFQLKYRMELELMYQENAIYLAQFIWGAQYLNRKIKSLSILGRKDNLKEGLMFYRTYNSNMLKGFDLEMSK